MTGEDERDDAAVDDPTQTLPDAPAAKLRATGREAAAEEEEGGSSAESLGGESSDDAGGAGDEVPAAEARDEGAAPKGDAEDGEDGAEDDEYEAEDEEDGAEEDEDEAEDEDEEDNAEDGEDEEDDAEDGEDEEDDEAEDDEEADTGSGSSEEPTGPIHYRFFGVSDVGLIRDHNEDNFAIVDLETGQSFWGGEGELASPPEHVVEGTVGPKGIVFAVCDGMGGAAAGEVASQMAVDTIREVMLRGGPPKSRDAFAHRLVCAIEEAGSRIFGAAKMDRSRRGMGTTATVAGLVDRFLFVGQVGDSRCYVLRQGELTLITKDQSLVNQLIEAGQLTEEEAEAFEHSNIILQALGTTEEVSVDLTFLELRRGDRVMLCSDGLSGLVHNEMIAEVMASTDDLEEIAHRLVEMANAGGGHDNITCVVVDFDGEGLAVAPGPSRPVYAQYPLPPADEIDDDLPRREPTMKTGRRKPGADVKGVIEYEAQDPEVLTERFPWTMVLVAVVLLGIVVALVAASSDEPEPEIEGVVAPPPPSPVEVCVQTDVVDGELFIDGRSYGPLDEAEGACVELMPGAYRFEAKVGDSTVATSTVTVGEGTPADVELMLPEGAFQAPGEDAQRPDAATAEPPPDPGAVPSEGDSAADAPPTSGSHQASPPPTPSSMTTSAMDAVQAPPSPMTPSMDAVQAPPSAMTTSAMDAAQAPESSMTSAMEGAAAPESSMTPSARDAVTPRPPSTTSARPAEDMTASAMQGDAPVPDNPF